MLPAPSNVTGLAPASTAVGAFRVRVLPAEVARTVPPPAPPTTIGRPRAASAAPVYSRAPPVVAVPRVMAVVAGAVPSGWLVPAAAIDGTLTVPARTWRAPVKLLAAFDNVNVPVPTLRNVPTPLTTPAISALNACVLIPPASTRLTARVAARVMLLASNRSPPTCGLVVRAVTFRLTALAG